MKREKKVSKSDLRKHYDLDELEIIKLGPGWSKEPNHAQREADGSSDYYASFIGRVGSLFPSPDDKELLAYFFSIFSRAEFALKEAKYVNDNGRPQVQWVQFAKAIGIPLLAATNPAIREAINFLTIEPPDKQVVKDGNLTMQPRLPRSSRPTAAFLIDSVVIVRNNLFHGGKRTSGVLNDRDRVLLRHSLNLLCYAISLEPKVLRHFQPPKEARVA